MELDLARQEFDAQRASLVMDIRDAIAQDIEGTCPRRGSRREAGPDKTSRTLPTVDSGSPNSDTGKSEQS
jgi:hypothetical protein